MDTVLRDIRYAVRSLLRSPGFSAVAVLTLALGIGANTAIFGVFDAVLLRPLRYPDADRLYAIHERGADGRLIPVNALHFREWRLSTRSFEEMALLGPARFTLDDVGEPSRVAVARVTPSLFSTLGVQPSLGRAFLEEEDVPGRDAVVIVGHDLWSARFGADPAVVGRRIVLDGVPHEIIGVLPAGFDLPKLQHLYALEVTLERPQLWKPFAATPGDLRPLGGFNYAAIARLKAGITAAQANQELEAIQTELARRAPEPAEFHAALLPLAGIYGVISHSVTQRTGEFGVRMALGADWRRIVQLVIRRAMLPVVIGLLAGMAASLGAARLLRTLLFGVSPTDIMPFAAATLFLVSVALLASFVPASRAARVNPVDALRVE